MLQPQSTCEKININQSNIVINIYDLFEISLNIGPCLDSNIFSQSKIRFDHSILFEHEDVITRKASSVSKYGKKRN